HISRIVIPLISYLLTITIVIARRRHHCHHHRRNARPGKDGARPIFGPRSHRKQFSWDSGGGYLAEGTPTRIATNWDVGLGVHFSFGWISHCSFYFRTLSYFVRLSSHAKLRRSVRNRNFALFAGGTVDIYSRFIVLLFRHLGIIYSI
ncbi:hypothetical protein BKA70DRAFT_1333632, partial [Coprinopsis sp. MPI-PUGE-AT-0042]